MSLGRPQLPKGPIGRDPAVAKRRRSELQYRYRLTDKYALEWLLATHPRLHAQAVEAAEARIVSERGAELPGDDPQPQERAS